MYDNDIFDNISSDVIICDSSDTIIKLQELSQIYFESNIIKLVNYMNEIFCNFKNIFDLNRLKFIEQLLLNTTTAQTNNKIILDVETNGSYKIVQLSYYILDTTNNIIKQCNFYVNDGDNDIDFYNKISPQQITRYGIKPHHVMYKLSIDFSICSDIIGHNIVFDIGKVEQHFKMFNIVYNIPNIRYCTMNESKYIVKCLDKNGRIKQPKLSELCEYLQIEKNDDMCHDSLYDVFLTYKCYTKLLDIQINTQLEQLQQNISDLHMQLEHKYSEYIDLCDCIYKNKI